jgi:hypothetical protein
MFMQVTHPPQFVQSADLQSFTTSLCSAPQALPPGVTGIGLQYDGCEATTFVVEDRTSLAHIVQQFGANSTWVNVCMDSGLTQLFSCMFPPVDTELVFSCYNDASEDVYAEFVSLLNITSMEQLESQVDVLLAHYLALDIITFNDAEQVRRTWLTREAIVALQMSVGVGFTAEEGCLAAGSVFQELVDLAWHVCRELPIQGHAWKLDEIVAHIPLWH